MVALKFFFLRKSWSLHHIFCSNILFSCFSASQQDQEDLIGSPCKRRPNAYKKCSIFFFIKLFIRCNYIGIRCDNMKFAKSIVITPYFDFLTPYYAKFCSKSIRCKNMKIRCDNTRLTYSWKQKINLSKQTSTRAKNKLPNPFEKLNIN